ncbi:hypothetical protein B484DRAFT_389913 [Ochromonadaceae sp. CCMP2298]|nr:hypothetical protein B484DRAFT_389913 [Ochromonadaceae sp. CCMP2298]
MTILAFTAANVLSGSKVSASIKDTKVDGLEGLNIELAAPFKLNDYVVGFNYKLGDLRKGPDSLFAKKSFETAGEGKASVDAKMTLSDQKVKADVTWESDSMGLTVGVSGDSKDKVTKVSALKSMMLGDNKISLKAAYDLPGKIASGFGSYNVDGTLLNVEYSTEDKDPVLSVTKSLDDNNDVTPSVGLKSGSLAYAWTRKWTGGSVKTKLTPGEKVDVEWKDEGAGGVWTTSAEFPLEDSAAAKVSISRDWKY